MRSKFTPFVLLGLVAWPVLGDEPLPSRPAIKIQLVRPDREAERVMALFRGSRANDPAQALAAWKRASVEPKRLGKPLEAIIAAINPRMVPELRTLDGAEIAIEVQDGIARPSWSATLPHDDGTFAALASAFVLSGGAEEPAIGAVSVDRLGPPGAPLMAQGPRALVLATTRNGLESALARSEIASRSHPVAGPAWRLTLDSGALPTEVSSPWLVAFRALLASGCRQIRMTAGLSGTAFEVATTTRFRAEPVPVAPEVDPTWLDLVPRDRAVAAATIAFDPSGWDAAFALADRVEQSDPARADVAPTRVRVGLLARAFGVRVEADVLPHLRGISGWVGSGPNEAIEYGLLAAHFADEAVASRVLGRIKPNPALTLERRGATVLVAWGLDAMKDSLDALDHPDRSAGPILRSGWANRPPMRAGGVWPGRVPGLVPVASPLAVALADAPPVVWSGWCLGSNFEDQVRWEDLDATIRRFLELLPLDPPPDR